MTDDAKPESLAHGRFLQLLRRGRWEYVERLHSSGVVVMGLCLPGHKLECQW